ncbi:MAG: hypothetical protein ACOZNI_17670 [Myxococcota bacterium]
MLPLLACAEPPPPPPDPAAADRLAAIVRARVLAGDLARESGWVQTVEVGQLLTWAARAGEREVYDALKAAVLANALRDDADDPYTRGMVLWRWKPGEPPDASGTTEALRVAEGLWEGGDRDLARLVLDGYLRHVRVDQGTWMVANYFNLGTRAFATNTYLVDYDCDFLDAVATATGDPALATAARQSRALVRRARTPAGLIYDLVQPEVATLLPAEMMYFSPNDVVQLPNALTVAAECARTEPELARGVLAFAEAHADNVYWYGRTGERAMEARPGAETWAAMVRLADALGDDRAVATWRTPLLRAAAAFPPDGPLYAASEMLLAFDAAAP